MDFQAGSLGEWTSVTCSAVNKRPSFRRNLDKKLVKELFTESVLPDVNYSNLTLTSSDNFQESLSLDFSIAPKCAFCKIVCIARMDFGRKVGFTSRAGVRELATKPVMTSGHVRAEMCVIWEQGCVGLNL